MYSGMKSTID